MRFGLSVDTDGGGPPHRRWVLLLVLLAIVLLELVALAGLVLLVRTA